MIIEAIRKFLKDCPLLKSGKINVNYLGEEPVRYTIDSVPVNPVIKKYTDGSSQRQFLFVFASREYYDADTLSNLETAKFYEEFANWIEDQDKNRNLPQIEDSSIEPQSIQVMASGYAYDTSTGNARFQIQCRLIYKKER